ncbi:hydantoinase B/oxoprolinase family protein [Chloroflexota bacterium]
MKLDMVTVQVISNRIGEIQNVMMQTLFRTGYSVILRESKDGSAGITDKEGGCIKAVGGLTMDHSIAYRYGIRSILAAWPRQEIRDGDIFIFNDPYQSGNFHLPDISQATPVFYDRQLVAFCTSTSHKADVGGLVPGSSGGASRSLFHEGIIIPPVKVCEQGKLNESIMRLLMRNSREPYLLGGDLRGQQGCLVQGAEMLKRLCHEYGIEVVLGSFEEIMNISERRMRTALRELPDGETEVERYLDNDGADLTKPVKIHLRLKKIGDCISLDFSGSDPQTVGPVNGLPSLVEAMSLRTIVGFLDPDIVVNQGTARVIELTVPEGCVLNPVFPAPKNAYVPTGRMVRHCVMAALSELYPERAVAELGIGSGALTFGYRQARAGQHYVQYEIVFSAIGANSTSDGANLLSTIANSAFVAPIEILETEYPVKVREFDIRPDSGGAGKYRGGVAYIREYQVLEDCSFTARVSGMRFSAQGIHGGKAARKARLIVNPGTPEERELPALCSTELHAGDIVRHEEAGGGGYGDALQRDRDAVIRDVEDGYVTAEAAKEEYGLG